MGCGRTGDSIANMRLVAVDPLLRRLGGLAELSNAETEIVRRSYAQPRSIHLPLQRLPSSGCHKTNRPAGYVVTGLAAFATHFNNGRRQLIQLILPGDLVFPTIGVRDERQEAVCLTQVEVIDAGLIFVAATQPAVYPGLASAVERAAAESRSFLGAQVGRLGRQTAYERIANLILELHYRWSAIGMVNQDSFPWPLTQEMLGDLLGLSVVHINRMLQLLRRQGIIEQQRGWIHLLDIGRLRDAAAFESPILTAESPRSEQHSPWLANRLKFP